MKQRKVPLLIDMRPLEQFERAHITNSININVPTLLIKRYRRGVIPNNFNLESFITTPEGTDQYRIWLEQFKEAADDDEIRVIIYDDHTTSKDKSTGTWTLAGVIYKIIHSTTANTATEVIEVIHGLQGGFHGFVEWDTEGNYNKAPDATNVHRRASLFSLDTNIRPTMTPKTEHEYDFVISEIIPKFLYLGPEILTEEQVMDLKHRSIKRVLNMAEECDDDVSGLKETFAYQKIAARDTVEMQNVQGTLRKAVRAIDDSKKHHEPIYVHCKAGKSRSAAAILAYLVLSEHWTLKKAYQHIVKARPNISPNIGFVAELMKMEEGVHGQVSNFASTDWQLMLTNPPSPDTQKEMGRLERVWKRGRSSSNVTRNTSLNSDTSSHRNSLDSSRSSIGSKTCSISWNEDDEL
ncbi:protein-tyrosine phosphatase-like protein [Mycotypha africana]|uniref:protein-tyrosine phosphatase-like protein n=1 Tax=Mycotypha africana TaxID=64632 RepID=UPI0023002FBD|nr:protein-tyrosine phosphatase-like protein [Mycotypha africana]KAI8991295.1 protein-tyrosine phosphatase-like protein [Mycotypha africana]